MSTEEIFAIANALQAEGKTPTVALIKHRLSSPVPLNLLISTLQRWKQSPTNPPAASEVDLSPPAVPEAWLALLRPLEQEIRQLRSELAELKAQLQDKTAP